MTDRQTDRQTDRKNVRNSGVELLKIGAILLIVISHVTATLGIANTFVDFQGYVYPIGNATTDLNALILMLFYQFGMLGNNIFFVCSAWFLVSLKKTARRKGFSLLCTTWPISIIALMIFFGAGQRGITLELLAKCLFPTTFSTNWFVTCYIIFLFIYPYLNMMIEQVEQKNLLRVVLFSSFLWILADYFYGKLFFASFVILWVTVYFLVAYLKLYCSNITSNKKIGFVLILIGAFGFVGQVLVTNYLGLHIRIISDKVLRWNGICNPFYIMIALGSLIIALQSKFKNKCINYISSLSLFVYLVHNNYLLRTYTIPAIWQWIYTTADYTHIILLDLVYAVLLFLASIVVSAIYKETVQRLVNKVSDKLYMIVGRAYNQVETFILEKVN